MFDINNVNDTNNLVQIWDSANFDRVKNVGVSCIIIDKNDIILCKVNRIKFNESLHSDYITYEQLYNVLKHYNSYGLYYSFSPKSNNLHKIKFSKGTQCFDIVYDKI